MQFEELIGFFGDLWGGEGKDASIMRCSDMRNVNVDVSSLFLSTDRLQLGSHSSFIDYEKRNILPLTTVV